MRVMDNDFLRMLSTKAAEHTRLPLRIFNTLSQAHVKYEDKLQIARVNDFIHQIHGNGSGLDPAWKGQQVLSTVTDITVVTLGPEGGAAQALLKLAKSEKAAADLKRQSQVLSSLQADPRLDGWHSLLPGLIAEGRLDDQYYVVETRLPGVDARSLLRPPELRDRMLASASLAIGDLHRRTASILEVDSGFLTKWVDNRLSIVREVLASPNEQNYYTDRLNRLAEELYWSFSGRKAPVGWIHGDFGPGNILVTPNGEKVLGVVDWGLASPEDLPLLDLVHLLLSARMYIQDRELGDVIRQLLDEGDWTKEEKVCLDGGLSLFPTEPMDMRAPILLAWLRHIASNLTKSPHYAKHWLWITRNVKGVLESL
jgi:serine/threonine protein kinase